MAFPTPFNGVSALYPVTRDNRYRVQILKFDDGTEQRYRQSEGVARFTLSMSEITKTEKDSIVSFFNTCKGSFDATWDIVLGGTTYGYMAFADDAIKPTENESGKWSLNIQLVQTRKN